MSRGFVLRAALGVAFSAASFVAAVLVHPREAAGCGIDAVASGFVDLLESNRCDALHASSPRADGDAARDCRARAHCAPVHG